MKTQLFSISVSVMILLMLFGCSKDKETDQKTDYLLINTTGDYTFAGNLDTSIYVSSFSPYDRSIKIDLNNDMTDDIEFYCSVYLHTVYREWSAAVRTLNSNVSLYVEADTSTIASFSIPLAIPPGDDTIIIYYNENYNPAKQYPSNLTTVNKIYKFPVVCSVGDTLNEFCNWQSGAFGLISDDHNQGQIQNNILLGTWRNIDDKFIGIRFIENSVVHYGWIELGVMDYTITLYKYALNRNQ
jgi:hypothetical protein